MLVRMVRTSTRDEILAVAAQQFTHAGFKGTSLQDIAAEVGCSKATVLYHFASKEAILAELVAPAAAELAELDARLSALDPATAQVAAIEGFVDLVLRYRREAALIYDGSLDALASPAFADLRPLTDNLCAFVARRSDDLDDCVAARVLLAGICAVAIDKTLDQPDDEGLRQALVGVAKRALVFARDKD
jgi:AcrR family transcriptional regulator